MLTDRQLPMILHAPCTLPARMPTSIPPYTPPCSMQGEACCPVGGWGAAQQALVNGQVPTGGRP
jgi:hypothetical protein